MMKTENSKKLYNNGNTFTHFQMNVNEESILRQIEYFFSFSFC